MIDQSLTHPRPSAEPAGLVPASYAEKSMAALMQLHGELMSEKERRVDLYRRLMEKEQAVAELKMYIQLLEAKLPAGLRSAAGVVPEAPAEAPVPRAPVLTRPEEVLPPARVPRAPAPPAPPRQEPPAARLAPAPPARAGSARPTPAEPAHRQSADARPRRPSPPAPRAARAPTPTLNLPGSEALRERAKAQQRAAEGWKAW